MFDVVLKDRREAGQRLGQVILASLKAAAEKPPHPLVLALPRGGVPVAFEIALSRSIRFTQ